VLRTAIKGTTLLLIYSAQGVCSLFCVALYSGAGWSPGRGERKNGALRNLVTCGERKSSEQEYTDCQYDSIQMYSRDVTTGDSKTALETATTEDVQICTGSFTVSHTSLLLIPQI
jgi:hypothetical protein